MSTAEAADIFAALGDATRLAIVARLRDGVPRSIAALAAEGAITRQAFAKHLRVLADAGLVAGDRVGRETRYTMRPDAIARAQAALAEIAGGWDDALARLKAQVER